MTIGTRIEHRRIAIGIPSQSELARRVRMGQSTLNGLIRKPYRSSPYLPRLARELRTTVDYLVGDTDDPDIGAPPPPPDPAHQLLMLPVAFPSEAVLTRALEGLLRPFELDREALLARTLARQLPRVLRQLQGPLIVGRDDDRDLEAAEAAPESHPAPRRARST